MDAQARILTLVTSGGDPREKPVPAAWRASIDHWLTHLAASGASKQSIRTRRDHLRRVARAVGGDPRAVTGDQLIAWAARQQWARETRRSVYNSLRSYYGHMDMDADPAASLPRVRASEPRPRPTPEVIYRTALTGAVDVRVRVALRLAAEAGLRRTEVSLVHASDLQPDLLGWSLLAHGKGGKDRLVPLGDDLAREVRLLARGGWLLPGRIDGHLSGAYVGKLVARSLPGAWTMHTLRHRFGTLAAEDGDLIAVQRLLGHTSVATTQRYVLRPDDALRRAAAHAA